MNKFVLILIALSTTFTISARGEYYKYTDKNGDILFTDDLSKIPENQRAKVKEFKERKQLPQTTTPENASPPKARDTPLKNQKSKAEIALQKLELTNRKILDLRKTQPEEFVKQYGAALSEFEKLSVEYVDDPHLNDLIKNVGLGYLLLGDFVRFNLRSSDKATLFYQKSAELSQKTNDPGSIVLELRLADLYQFDFKDKANAIKYYRRALASRPAGPAKQQELDSLTDWWGKWIEYEIKYLETGQPFAGTMDREALEAFPMAVMVLAGNINFVGVAQFDAGVYSNEGLMKGQINPNLNQNTVFQKLQKLPTSHFALSATIYAISYLPTPESILTYMESQDPGHYWSASILCSAALYRTAGPSESSKARSFLFPGAATAPSTPLLSLVQMAADLFQKRSGVRCAVAPDQRFASPEKTWEYLMSSLEQGDVETALSSFTPSLKEKRKSLFSKMSSNQMNKLAKSFSGFAKTKNSGDGDLREYVVLRRADDKDMLGFIYFTNIFGEWKINEM